MYYAISTINASATGYTGWQVYGKGATEEAAEENATDTIGGRGMAKTARESTLYRNMRIVTEDDLKKYGID